MKKWLEANPGKTERDWLIEVRCTTDEQRNALNEILDQCDVYGISYKIGVEVNLPDEYAKYLSENQSVVDDIVKTYQSIHRDAPIDFDSLNSERFVRTGLKFIETKNLDLYFPSICWYINIGEEIDDAVTECHRMTWNEGERSNLVEIYIVAELVNGFYMYISNKYQLPLERQKNGYGKPQLLPWNHTIAKSESINEYLRLPFDIKEVYSFIHCLFQDKYREVVEQIVSNRREKFLSVNPDIKKQRAEMLHTMVIGMQREIGIGDTLDVHDIKDLLKTVDNELSVLYPEYHKLSSL